MEYSEEHPEEVKHKMVERFFHPLPYMLFITLPVVAFLLQLLYYRRKKQYYYVSHIIFMVHVYCFAFLVFILVFSIQQFGQWGHTIGSILKLSVLVYLFLAMLHFYKQHVGKTFIKFILFVLIGGCIIGVLTLIMVINTFLNLVS
jgi:cobalamin synthase